MQCNTIHFPFRPTNQDSRAVDLLENKIGQNKTLLCISHKNDSAHHKGEVRSSCADRALNALMRITFSQGLFYALCMKEGHQDKILKRILICNSLVLVKR